MTTAEHPLPGCTPDNCLVCQDLILHETPTQAAERNNRKTDRLMQQFRTATGRSRNLQFRVTQPRSHDKQGRPLCRSCGDYHDPEPKVAAVITTYPAPDPYAPGLALLRAANAAAKVTRAGLRSAAGSYQQLLRPTEIHLTNGVPDAYFNDLQKRRKEFK